MSTFAAGIDVGTTNIDALLLDIDEGRIAERHSIPNKRLASDDPLAYVQDADAIAGAARTLLGRFTRKPAAVGVSGQVHGVLYLDAEGRAVSPLYTWLDRHGEGEPQRRLAAETGVTLPVGYGLLTHYALRLAGMVPAAARRLTGINEYVTGVLAGGRPLDKTDDSILASYGCWDAVEGRHNTDALAAVLGGDNPVAFLGPAEPFTIAGYTPDGVPVAFPIGDNQAGFLGAVARPEEECLLSIGTSGQLSVFTTSTNCPADMELRPYFGRGWLHVGATLCAGKAWDTLAALFAEVLRLAGQDSTGTDRIHELMKSAAASAAGANTDGALRFDTALNGTRRDAGRRGSITNITLDNLTVGDLAFACAEGIAAELAAFAETLGPLFEPVKRVVAAGAAVRKNELLKPILERRFTPPLLIPSGEGGAALGAALSGALAAGLVDRDRTAALVESMR